MDRYLFTLQSLQSLDTEGGFDLIWNDGSKEPGVPALSRNYKFQNAKLVEINYGVTGGAECAVYFGLWRLLELGYDYVGLIENDILFRPGWFRSLMKLFSFAARRRRGRLKATSSNTARATACTAIQAREWFCFPGPPRKSSWICTPILPRWR
jgi:hypothetical protein